MKELLKVLTEIDNDFYKGVYTIGEYTDLVKQINKVLETR